MGMPALALLCFMPVALALDFECSETPLTVEYSIKYYSGVVNCGNLLLESDIGGTHKWIAPTVKWSEAEAGKLYAVFYVDPDVDLPNNGSWPDVQTPGSKAPARHWVVGAPPASVRRTLPGKDASRRQHQRLRAARRRPLRRDDGVGLQGPESAVGLAPLRPISIRAAEADRLRDPALA